MSSRVGRSATCTSSTWSSKGARRAACAISSHVASNSRARSSSGLDGARAAPGGAHAAAAGTSRARSAAQAGGSSGAGNARTSSPHSSAHGISGAPPPSSGAAAQAANPSVAATVSVSSASNRVLPIPAEPATIPAPPYPCLAASHACRRRPSSAPRPTSRISRHRRTVIAGSRTGACSTGGRERSSCARPRVSLDGASASSRRRRSHKRS